MEGVNLEMATVSELGMVILALEKTKAKLLDLDFEKTEVKDKRKNK